MLALGAGVRSHALPSTAVAAIRDALDLPELYATTIETRSGQRPRRGLLTLQAGRNAVGLGAALGRVESGTLVALAEALTQFGVSDVRLSPWRTIYAEVGSRGDGEAPVETARAQGLIVDDAGPLVRIDA